MRIGWKLPLFGAVLLAAASGIGWRMTVGPLVEVVPVVRQPLVQRVVANGRVQAPARIRIGALATGRVISVHVREGAQVVRDQLLVELEAADLRASQDQARAAVTQARARLQQLRAVGGPTAREELRQAEIAQQQAQRKLDRVQELQRQQVISPQEVEHAQAELELARSRRVAAVAREQSLAPGGSEALLAEANLAAAQANLAQVDARLAQTRLLAPTPGQLLRRLVEPGDVVQPGTPLLELAQAGERYLTVQPEEASLAVLREGQLAAAVADAFPDRPFPARVTEIAPAVDAERGTIEVKLALPEPPEFLRPDMTVSVDVEVGRVESALVVPAELVRNPEEQPWLLLVRDGRVERRSVTLGLRGDGMLEVRDGVREGELILRPTGPPPAVGQRVRSRPGS